ncbi:MAG: hypothetical protein AABW75_02005 [Nanoarchaeota archaeon]
MKNLEKIVSRLRPGQRVEVVHEAPYDTLQESTLKAEGLEPRYKKLVIGMGYFVRYFSGNEKDFLQTDEPFIYVQKEVDTARVHLSMWTAPEPIEVVKKYKNLHTKKAFPDMGDLMKQDNIIKLSDIKSIKKLKLR